MTPTQLEQAQHAAQEMYFGAKLAEAAGTVGVTVARLRGWTQEDWWPDLIAHIAENELEYLAAKARGVVLRLLQENDGITARWVLERRDKQFANKATAPADAPKSVEAQKIAELPNAELDRLLAASDDAIDAAFEEARPLGSDED